MKKYNGVEYEKKGDRWQLNWPSGLKTYVNGDFTEEELKAMIDATKQILDNG